MEKHAKIHMFLRTLVCSVVLISPASHVFALTDGLLNGNVVSDSYSPPPLPGDVIDIRSSSVESKFKDSMIDVFEAVSMDINEALSSIAAKTQLTIVTDEPVSGSISVNLPPMAAIDALRVILDLASLAYYEKDGAIHVLKAENFQSRFGLSFNDAVKTKVIPLLYSNPDNVLPYLEKLKTPEGKIIFNPVSKSFILIDAADNIQAMVDTVVDIDVPVESKEFHLVYEKAAAIASKIEEMLTKDIGQVQVDHNLNNINVTDKKDVIEKIEAFIQVIDQEDKVISFAVKQLRIVLNEEHPDGVDWEAIVSGFRSMSIRDLTQDASGRERILSVGTISQEDFSVLLDALDTVGIVVDSGDEELLGKEKKESRIDASLPDEIMNPGIKSKQSTVASDQEVGISLTPDIIEAESINLSISLQGKRVGEAFNADAPREGISFNVPNSSTLVLGGYFKDVKMASVRKLPLLGDLPIVGFAFRNQGQTMKKSELVVFITPKILDQPEERTPEDPGSGLNDVGL